MLFTIKELQMYQSIKSVAQLEKQSKKDSKAKLILKNLQDKIKARKNASYENQKVQTSVINKILTLTSTKYTTSNSFVDEFQMLATEVKKLQIIKINYEQFKSLFAFVSKFVLCNYSTKQNLCKHERFYSQCLAQINLVLNRFTADVIHSRSKKLKIKDVTIKNVSAKYNEFCKLLFNSKVKAQTAKLVKTKSKTAKLVKAKSKTAKQKIQNAVNKVCV